MRAQSFSVCLLSASSEVLNSGRKSWLLLSKSDLEFFLIRVVYREVRKEEEEGKGTPEVFDLMGVVRG